MWEHKLTFLKTRFSIKLLSWAKSELKNWLKVVALVKLSGTSFSLTSKLEILVTDFERVLTNS